AAIFDDLAPETTGIAVEEAVAEPIELAELEAAVSAPEPAAKVERKVLEFPNPGFTRDDLHQAIELVRQMDPVGVGARDLRECLLAQLKDLARAHYEHGGEPDMPELLADATVITDKHLHLLQNKQMREIGRA